MHDARMLDNEQSAGQQNHVLKAVKGTQQCQRRRVLESLRLLAERTDDIRVQRDGEEVL